MKNNNTMDIPLNFKGGGSFVTHPPQFSLDSENVYVVWKNSILCYSTKTGLFVTEFKGMTGNIVGFTVHNYQNFECITACSEIGEMITWKVATHFKMFTKKFENKHVNFFTIVCTNSTGFNAVISHEVNNEVFFMSFDSNDDICYDYNGFFLPNNSYKIHSSTKYFVVVHENNIFFVQIGYSDKFQMIKCMTDSRDFTCVTCHPEEEIVLTGDCSGRVVCWQNIFSNKKVVKSVYHWHTLPVKCLVFSPIGSYFYSGGEECVLVRWQFDNHLEKKFLPRLPDAIEQLTISKCNLYIAIANSDNAIRIINSRFDQVSLIQHLVIGKTFESGILLDPRTKALIMNGNVGHLQFYCPKDKNLIYNIDIVGQNKITRERYCEIECTKITKIAISKNGLWLNTIEERIDTEFSSELRMKFWKFNLLEQMFELNTSIEDPHTNTIDFVLFQPCHSDADFKCVTVGADKTFKIWQLYENSKNQNKTTMWKCFGIGFYKHLPCKGLSFSVDGSLIAVGFGPIVTTWLPDSCDLKCSLVHPLFKQQINQVQFGNGNQCHLLVGVSDDYLGVWNLLTLSLIWITSVQSSILIASPLTPHMALITNTNKLFVFTPNSSKPVYVNDTLLKDHKYILTAAFVPNKNSNDSRLKWYQRCPIYFVNKNKELYCLGEDKDNLDTIVPVESTDQSLFKKMLTKQNINHIQNVNLIEHKFTKDASLIRKFLDTSVYTMAPMKITCKSLLASMILQKNQNESVS